MEFVNGGRDAGSLVSSSLTGRRQLEAPVSISSPAAEKTMPYPFRARVRCSGGEGVEDFLVIPLGVNAHENRWTVADLLQAVQERVRRVPAACIRELELILTASDGKETIGGRLDDADLIEEVLKDDELLLASPGNPAREASMSADKHDGIVAHSSRPLMWIDGKGLRYEMQQPKPEKLEGSDDGSDTPPFPASDCYPGPSNPPACLPPTGLQPRRRMLVAPRRSADVRDAAAARSRSPPPAKLATSTQQQALSPSAPHDPAAPASSPGQTNVAPAIGVGVAPGQLSFAPSEDGGKRDWPPLMRAAYRGDSQEVSKLLDDRADVNATVVGGNQRTALYYAMQFGFSEVVRMLLRQPGTDVHGKMKAGKKWVTPLDIARDAPPGDELRRVFSDAGFDLLPA